MGGVCCMNDEDTGDSLLKVRVGHNDPEQEEIMTLNSPEVLRLHKILQEISSKRSVTPSFLETLYETQDPVSQEQRDAKQTCMAPPFLDEICSWRVVYGEAHPVFAEKTSELRKMVGVRQLGDVVQAHQDGEWLILAGKLGVMRMVTASGIPVVERIDDTLAEPVLGSHDAREQLGTHIQDSKVDMRSLERITDTFNEQTSEITASANQVKLAANVSSDVCSWVVVYKTRFPIHSDMSKQTLFLGTKNPGDVFRGHQVGDWVALADEPGYIRLVAANTGTVVLERVGDNAANKVQTREHNESLRTTSDSAPDTIGDKLVAEYGEVSTAQAYSFGGKQPVLISSSI